MTDRATVRPPIVLVVCLGNICRSPTGEAALREAAKAAGVPLEVRSGGTGAWHVGAPPDPRSVAAASEVGLRLDGTAHHVTSADLEEADLVLAMDRSNLHDLRELAKGADVTTPIRLFREWDPEANDDLDVPDPYYGGPEGFVEVVDIVQRTAQAIVAAIAEGALERTVS